MLFNVKPVRDATDVRREIQKVVARQKRGSPDDLSGFQQEIDALLSSIEFHDEWKKAPCVFRAAHVNYDDGNTLATVGDSSRRRMHLDNVVLPDIKHDIDLVIKMLNHMRVQKGLAEVKMPLFIQPDEIAPGCSRIYSQMSVVFQKGAVMWVGFVFGRDYVLLQG